MPITRRQSAVVVLSLVAAMVAVAISPASATATGDASTTGYVITVDPDATPSDIVDLVSAIEAASNTRLQADLASTDVAPATEVDVVFEQKLSNGMVGTFGISSAAIREEGLDAFDLSTMVEDMMIMDEDIKASSAEIDNERAALAELYVTLKGTLSTPQRLIVTTSGQTATAALERFVDASVGFDLAPAALSLPESGAAPAAATDGDCTYYSPKSGQTAVGYSQTHPGKRYTQTYSKWSHARVNHIHFNCSVNSTFEIETHSTVVGGHFLGDYYKWFSSLPSAYKDIGFDDGGNTIEGQSTKQWTIGTAQLDDVLPNENYRSTMWTQPGTATVDKFMSNGQLGIQIPPGCTSAWCIYARDSYYLVQPWIFTPGTGYWEKSSY
jgi:hypothetical protein